MNTDCTILIVDDEPLASQRLSRLLHDLGLNAVLVADSGPEALAICQTHQPDIVLLDVRMPGMDGLQVAEAINAQSLSSEIIFTTAYDEYALPAFDVSASGYLLKPINKQRLNEAINLASQRALGKQKGSESPRIRCQHQGATVLIALQDIRALVAEDKYVTVHHHQGQALTNTTLKQLNADFQATLIRIHRNALINKNHIVGIKRVGTTAKILLDGIALSPEISRRWLPQIKRLIADVPAKIRS